MARYYILIKPKRAKKPIGAILARSNLTKAEINKRAKKGIKTGLSFKVVSATEFSKLNKKVKRKPITKKRK